MRSKHVEKVQAAVAQVSTAQQELLALRHQVEHQRLLIRAIWELLKRAQGRNDDELLAAVRDLEAQERNGEQHDAVKCARCGRHLQGQSPVCIYCGEENEKRNIF